jgi:hypothetical protein
MSRRAGPRPGFRCRSPPVGGLCGVGLFETADLVVGEVDLQGGDGIGEVVGFGGADDGADTTGLDSSQAMPIWAIGTALFGDLLDSLDDGLVDVEVDPLTTVRSSLRSHPRHRDRQNHFTSIHR